MMSIKYSTLSLYYAWPLDYNFYEDKFFVIYHSIIASNTFMQY